MSYATKPTTKVNWIPTGTEPSGATKNTGYAVEESWPTQEANWFFNIVDQWLKWLEGSIDFIRQKETYNILVGSESKADFATLALYLAGAPAAGDRVYLANDETIAAKLTIPSDISIRQRRGKKLSTTTDLTDFIEFGDNVEIEGNLKIELNHTGTLANAVLYNGNGNSHQNIVVENKSTGTLTNAFVINASKKTNIVRGETLNTGGGTITNHLVDSSGEMSNDIEIRERS